MDNEMRQNPTEKSEEIQEFINFIVSAQYAKISFLRMNEIRQPDDEEDLLSVGAGTVLPESRDITLENVMFQYTGNSPMVLCNIRLHIPQNKVTAIVGGSGSGKSTLLKLLVRLYRPSYGDIKMGGMNVKPSICANDATCAAS